MNKVIFKFMKIIFNKNYRFLILSNKGFYKKMDDKSFLEKKYYLIMKKKLNLENPETFNEKLQWLKLYDRKPIYTDMVDKFTVRKYIASTLGDEYLIPLIGAWDNVDDIDFNILPNRFVLKCNHNSGLGMFVCKDKSNICIKKVKKELKKGMSENYYWSGREWPYKNVKKKIIAEKYMEDESGGLIDYKFFCFNGKVDNIMVCIDRHIDNPKFYFFDKDWQLLRLNVSGKNAPKDFTLPKPHCLNKMIEIASILSKDIPFVRVDLYECSHKIYFGEMTFFPQSGFDYNLLSETDKYLGDLITIPKGGK